MSVSFRDLPVLYETIGGSLNISLSRGCCWIKCHFCMSICFKLGIVGRYCVTKGRNVISVSDISAVNLIVGWWLFACSMNCVTPSLFIFQIEIIYFDIPQRPHFCLKLLFWIDRCRRRHRRSCSFSFLWTFSLARHFRNKSDKFKSNELWSRVQLLSREMLVDTSSLVGRPDILLAVGIGSIQSVDILRSKGVKCL